MSTKVKMRIVPKQRTNKDLWTKEHVLSLFQQIKDHQMTRYRASKILKVNSSTLRYRFNQWKKSLGGPHKSDQWRRLQATKPMSKSQERRFTVLKDSGSGPGAVEVSHIQGKRVSLTSTTPKSNGPMTLPETTVRPTPYAYWRTINIDSTVFEHLQKHAEPFEDTPNSVLRRLLKI